MEPSIKLPDAGGTTADLVVGGRYDIKSVEISILGREGINKMDKIEINRGARPSIGTDYLDALNKSRGSNRDTEGLGAMASAGGGLIIGSVDAINGQDGEEVEFAVTRHELHALAEYWWTERIDHDFWFFVCQQTGSSEWRWSVYIARRLDRLQGVLGKESMDRAFDGAAARIRKLRNISDEEWRIFREGTDEEQEAWRDAQWRKHEEAEAQAAVRELAEDASKSEGK